MCKLLHILAQSPLIIMDVQFSGQAIRSEEVTLIKKCVTEVSVDA